MSQTQTQTQTQTFLVTGATGSQGGAVAHALLAANQYVHALVRDPASASSQQLAAAGARLFKGDFSDASAIKSAATGCTGVFINVSPTSSAHLELTHAQTIITASLAAGVQKCIYTSVVNAGRHTTFQTSNPSGAATPFDPTTTFRASYWLTKSAIQDAVSTTPGFSSWTILQPAFLLTNLVPPISRFYFQQLAAPPHIMRTAYTPMTRILITDPVDIGKFAVKAFLSHELDDKVVPVVCLEAPTMDEDGRDCTHSFGREWETGADGVCERGGISGDERQGYGCGGSGVGAGWVVGC